jgi:hypothetical protein
VGEVRGPDGDEKVGSEFSAVSSGVVVSVGSSVGVGSVVVVGASSVAVPGVVVSGVVVVVGSWVGVGVGSGAAGACCTLPVPAGVVAVGTAGRMLR